MTFFKKKKKRKKEGVYVLLWLRVWGIFFAFRRLGVQFCFSFFSLNSFFFLCLIFWNHQMLKKRKISLSRIWNEYIKILRDNNTKYRIWKHLNKQPKRSLNPERPKEKRKTNVTSITTQLYSSCASSSTNKQIIHKERTRVQLGQPCWIAIICCLSQTKVTQLSLIIAAQDNQGSLVFGSESTAKHDSVQSSFFSRVAAPLRNEVGPRDSYFIEWFPPFYRYGFIAKANGSFSFPFVIFFFLRTIAAG